MTVGRGALYVRAGVFRGRARLRQNVIANPCLRCGACCAYFRASFYWGEADDTAPNGVPVELTEDLTAFRRVMIGTNGKEPRRVTRSASRG